MAEKKLRETLKPRVSEETLKNLSDEAKSKVEDKHKSTEVKDHVNK